MKKELTLQTAAAFERIYDSLLGKTEDDLVTLVFHLQELSKKAKEIEDISVCLMNGDC